MLHVQRRCVWTTFDDYVYKGDATTLLYKYVDALCGVTGAGALINELLLARMGTALETIYFNDLDYVMGSLSFLARSPAESYNYNPADDMLTADQWDELRVKDAWYRARIKSFFLACTKGGTPDGVRQCVDAALGVGADLFETWRFEDNFGLGSYLGRAPTSARSEITVRPHKDTLTPIELRLVREMLYRIMPVESVVTVNLVGLAVSTPVSIVAATATSEYFEVQKIYRPTPTMTGLPEPESFAMSLNTSERWLFSDTPTLAPNAAFNVTQEHCYSYLFGGGQASPIDSVIYGTLQPDGSVSRELNYESFQDTSTYTDWFAYDRADSPDNYPGGKFGVHPGTTPALNPDGSNYTFPWASQIDFITDMIAKVISMGGVADQDHYKLPVHKTGTSKLVFLPEYAIAYSPPVKESTLTKSLTQRRAKRVTTEIRNPSTFAR